MIYYGLHGRVVRTQIYLSKVQVQWEESILPKHSVYPITGLSPYVPSSFMISRYLANEQMPWTRTRAYPVSISF